MADVTEQTLPAEASDELREFFEAQLGGMLDGLYGAALRLTREQADAEDLVAETVHKALNRLGTLKDRNHLRAWMFRILTNTFISEHRKRRVRPEAEAWPEDEGENEFSLFEKLHQPFMLWWGTPEQEFLNNVLREDLERAVDALPEVFRVVVVLTELQGFTYPEAARILRVPVGTVRSRLSRGRSLLQKELWQHAREAGLTTAGGASESANEDGMERKLAAVLYADVAGYSRLTEDDETATHHTVSAYLDLLTTAVNRYGGRVQHFAGDAVLADFGTVQAALQCAVCAQREFAAWNGEVPDERKVRFRIGINVGDVIVDRDDIYGDGVNVAARLEALAEPGGICLSGTVYDAIGGKLPLRYEFMGEQTVKNISTPVRAYRVVFDASSVEDQSRIPCGD